MIAVVTLGLAEGMARLVSALERSEIPAVARLVNARLQLNPYQEPSDRYPRHWRLRTGWYADSRDLAAIKRASGREEGARFLEQASSIGFGLPLVVNSDGFKGPDLLAERTMPRLLAVGDSVTFGVAGWDYVRAMEASLALEGLRMEGVNAGVEGYSTLNALHERPRLVAIRADVCLLMIGWNDLFAEDGRYGTLGGHFHFAGMIRRVSRFLADSDRSAADKALRDRPKRPVVDDADVRRYQGYRPAFVDDLERLGVTLEQGGCRIAISTLAGLYTDNEPPSAKALAIGHLPAFTDNPYVLAAMTAGTNNALRGLAARHGWHLVDIAAWADRTAHPRADWFSDGVHLWAWALARLGDELARELRSDLFSPGLAPPGQ
ncbi:SGNH/GDSL hydrolase family protein [Magnetospirillum moscoviense]|uniref:SGNH hydrolase-type esterase domain-containing protein n=1 Tax=Magnetospirillum moscoviense TaxID=1437059 RepID=A0A178MWH8_9PROT|nr:SGNH/GDSL hydrolase family protein [Magnetospirillum moscoviense]OAN55106.1 hypothetical protein A6A05_00665 [Magnetospirillum moscoviense]